MSRLRRIDVDRIVLTLQGVPVAQAEFLAAQLQAAMAAQPWPLAPQGPGHAALDASTPPEGTQATLDLPARLAGPALVDAVAARLLAMVGAARGARAASPDAVPDDLQDRVDGAPAEASPWP